MSTLPSDYDLIVYIGFGEDYTSTLTPSSWTDVTSDVLSIEISRGRSSRFESFSPGQCVIKLKDTVRDYDPVNTGSPYRSGGETQVIPGVPIVVWADQSDSTTKYLFHGFVTSREGWQFDYNKDPAYTEVTITALDWLSIFDNYRLQEGDLGDNDSELSSARAQDIILNHVGTPSAYWTTDTGIATLNGRDENESALSHLQIATLSEGGYLFEADPQEVYFYNRYSPWLKTEHSTSQETFSDDGSDIPYLHGSLKFGYYADVFDRVIIQREGEDDILEGTGINSLNLTVLNEDDLDALSIANFYHDQYSEPLYFPFELSVNPLVSDTVRDAALGLELRYRATVEYTPPNDGDNTQIVQEVFVERISHSISPGHWVTTFGFSSAEPDLFQNELFELDDDPDGKLDTGGVLVY